MARRQETSLSQTCARCGSVTHLPGARFCGQCGARLDGQQTDLPQWQRPSPAKYHHVVMRRIALSCPECGAPMRFGFRRVCRQCGARLVMLPRILHPNHYRVFVGGPRAALYDLAFDAFWLIAVLLVMAAIGGALK